MIKMLKFKKKIIFKLKNISNILIKNQKLFLIKITFPFLIIFGVILFVISMLKGETLYFSAIFSRLSPSFTI